MKLISMIAIAAMALTATGVAAELTFEDATAAEQLEMEDHDGALALIEEMLDVNTEVDEIDAEFLGEDEEEAATWGRRRRRRSGGKNKGLTRLTNYGNCCGQHRHCNNGRGGKNKLDNFCAKHDKCLARGGGCGCDGQLCNNLRSSGFCRWNDAKCKVYAAAAKAVMCNMKPNC